MILKIKGNFKEFPANSFFDGFDYVEVQQTDLEHTQTLGEAVSNFIVPYESKTDRVRTLRRITLFKGLNIILRTVFVDYQYDVFLMSNEGKTVERL